jgi:hypothetical protein
MAARMAHGISLYFAKGQAGGYLIAFPRRPRGARAARFGALGTYL